eukprot:jgi/Galph1/4319/GphlegSOOS_G2992.1
MLPTKLSSTNYETFSSHSNQPELAKICRQVTLDENVSLITNTTETGELENPTPTGTLNVAKQRWVLTLVCLFSVGSHFGKHSLSALATPILHSLSISKQQYGWLFSMQNLPGVFIPLLSGYISSLVSPPFASVLFSTVLFGGQIMYTIGIVIQSYLLTLFGKIMFGFGDGSLIVIQGVVIAKYFAPISANTCRLHEFSDSRIGPGAAYGTMIAVSRLSTLLSLSVPAWIASHKEDWGGYITALWVSLGISSISLLAAFLYMLLESADMVGRPRRKSLRRISSTALSPLLVGIMFIWMLMSCCIFCFLHFSTDIFLSGFSVTWKIASLLNIIITLLPCLISPLLGQLQDRIGHRPLFVCIACIFLCTAMILFWLCSYQTSNNNAPFITWKYLLLPCLLMGLSFALGPVALLSCLILVSQDKDRGFVLGCYKAMENLSLMLVQPFVGCLRDETENYTLPLFALAFSVL